MYCSLRLTAEASYLLHYCTGVCSGCLGKYLPLQSGFGKRQGTIVLECQGVPGFPRNSPAPPATTVLAPFRVDTM